jgi:hypothetical protein
MRAGQALRGSSEFHAWGDSNLYLRRHGEQLTLSVEHRAAASITALSLQLAVDGDAVALATLDRSGVAPAASAAPVATPAAATVAPAAATVAQKIEAQLSAAAAPLTAAAIRKLCRIRNATLTATLTELVANGRIRKDKTGYVITR